MSRPGLFARLVPLIDRLFGHESTIVKCSANLEESVRRLAAVTGGSGIVRWSDTTLSGFISEQYVYLLKQTTVSSGGFRLRFVGRFQVSEVDGGVMLIGRFSLPWSAIAIFLVGFSVCAAWFVNCLGSTLFTGSPLDNVQYSGLTLVGVGVLLLITRALGARDKRWIKRRIKTALESRVDDFPQGTD